MKEKTSRVTGDKRMKTYCHQCKHYIYEYNDCNVEFEMEEAYREEMGKELSIYTPEDFLRGRAKVKRIVDGKKIVECLYYEFDSNKIEMGV
jgi:hypothetical protein